MAWSLSGVRREARVRVQFGLSGSYVLFWPTSLASLRLRMPFEFDGIHCNVRTVAMLRM